MTDPDPMVQEMIRVKDGLRLTSELTKDIIDARMRATVKELIGYHYAPMNKPAVVVPKGGELMQAIKDADIITDLVFGLGLSPRRQYEMAVEELNRTRPLRIYSYVLKLANIFPSEHLTRLLRSSLNSTPEELIWLYEANKGEARQSDFSGEPTGIDPNQFKVPQARPKKLNNNLRSSGFF